MHREGTPLAGATLSVTAIVSVQFGAASAVHLFPLVGPLGTVSVRLMAAGLLLLALARPWRRTWTRAELGAAVGFGAVFTAMNCFLYEALGRLPLATVITLEFLGPLAVTVIGARGWAVRAWAIPAAGGVALLGGQLAGDDAWGVVFALCAAVMWAAYILVSGRTGRTGSGLAGLSVGCVFGALVMLPVGLGTVGSQLWQPQALVLGALVGVLASGIPYTLDLLALRRLPTAVFGVLTSLNPGVGAVAGYLVLDQTLSGREVAGVALVTVASVGVTLRRPRRRPGAVAVQPELDALGAV